MAEPLFLDGTGITPGTEGCKCGPECEMPCWMRVGQAPACKACGCAPFAVRGARHKPRPINVSPKDVARFWGFVARAGTDDCWEWQGSVAKEGYGQFSLERRNATAHRVSYVIHNGEPHENMVIDHLCGNRACVNPAHLEAVSHAENLRRGPSTKLTYDLVALIRESPLGCRELGRQLGVHHSRISAVRLGKAWST